MCHIELCSFQNTLFSGKIDNMCIYLCLRACDISDTQGGSHLIEELRPQHRADGGSPALPFRHDQTVQQQP